MNKAPNPGSDEARKQGCKCPVLDNEYGRGYYGNPDLFVINEDCELHNGKDQSREDQNQTN